MGWLHAVPNDRAKRPAKTRVSRLEKLQKAGSTVSMPPVHIGGHLVTAMMDVGPATQGAAGLVPLSYTEIQAWSQLAAFELAPWEAQLLRKLSRTYASSVHTSEDPLAPPPYVRPKPVSREEVGNRVSSLFAMLAAKGRKK